MVGPLSTLVPLVKEKQRQMSLTGILLLQGHKVYLTVTTIITRALVACVYYFHNSY